MSDTPYPLDHTALAAEVATLRAKGAATLVELTGGVVAWSVTQHDSIKRLLTDSRVSTICRGRDHPRGRGDGQAHGGTVWPALPARSGRR